MAVITIDHVTKNFGRGYVVKEFTGEFADGEFVTFLGPSGCGKTTMLRMIAGFEKPTDGEIRIDGKTVTSKDTFLPPEKRNIGMVFQSYAVWPHMTVFDNVAYPLKIRKVSKEETRERVEKVLAAVHLERYTDRMPSTMSGGQQQRVALARALVSEPKLLLLDEPLSNLDAKLREQMRFEIKELQQRLHINIVYVTHDQSEAMTMSDRIFVLNGGVIQQVGTPYEIYTRPANQFVADFVGKINFLKGHSENGKITLEGIDDVLEYDGEITGDVDIGIRPENIRITGGSGHLNGTVITEFFMGDTNDCRVQVGKEILRVIADAATYQDFKTGTSVGLEIRDFLVFPQVSQDPEQ